MEKTMKAGIVKGAVVTNLVGAMVTYTKWFEHQWFLTKDARKRTGSTVSDDWTDVDFTCRFAEIRVVYKDKDGAIRFIIASPITGEMKDVYTSWVLLCSPEQIEEWSKLHDEIRKKMADK